jgi:hypothetical protein
MPFADASARPIKVADVARATPEGAQVPLFTVPTARLPLRPLVGANMPALLVEVGFLSSPHDETRSRATTCQRPSLRRSSIRSVRCGARFLHAGHGGHGHAMNDPDPQLPGPDQVGATPVVRISQRNIWIAVAAGLGCSCSVWSSSSRLLPRLLSTPTETVPSRTRRLPWREKPVAFRPPCSSLPTTARAPCRSAGRCSTGHEPLEQARRIVEAVVEPAPDGQRSAIRTHDRPSRVSRGGRPTRSSILGGAIVSGHSGGTLNEALTVYAIVNAVTVNLRISRRCRFS